MAENGCNESFTGKTSMARLEVLPAIPTTACGQQPFASGWHQESKN